MKTIRKSKEIAAPREKVWSVLLEDAHTRMWLSAFADGSHAETDWIEGHKIKFLDSSGCGIIGKITQKQPYEILSFTYDGVVQSGVEDYDSEFAKEFNGATEHYRLSEQNGKTRLDIESDMDDENFEKMSEAWDKALEKIESLSLT